MTDPGDEKPRAFQLAQTWESIQEDEHGQIRSFDSDRERSRKLKSSRVTQSIRRGLIRFLNIVVDNSASSDEKDFRPTRLKCVKDAVSKFITAYFDQNPISQLCLSTTSLMLAEKVTDLSG